MRLIPIQPHNAGKAWKDIQQHVVAALEYVDGKYNEDDVVQMVAEQAAILWVVYNDEEKRAVGFLLTETLSYPRKRCLSIFLLGADDFAQIACCLEQLREFADGIGCSAIECFGRAGWEKTLKPLGFEKTHALMRLNL